MATQNNSRTRNIKKYKYIHIEDKIFHNNPLINNIDDINNVIIDNVSENDILTFSKGYWINKNSVASIPPLININDIEDVVIINPENGNILKYDGTNWYNTTETVPSITNSSDVVLTTPENGNILKYDGTNWYNTTETVPSITSSSDVVLTTPVDGSILSYSSGNWINNPNITILNGTISNNQSSINIHMTPELTPAFGDNNININTVPTGQGSDNINIGIDSGKINQGDICIAIGQTAGSQGQKDWAMAIGTGAGTINQHSKCLAIGIGAGYCNQSDGSVAIGSYAGNESQGIASIAIGCNAGYYCQNTFAIAIGTGAGSCNQKDHAIAIGVNAGNCNQGTYSIALGYNAGVNLGNNSIYIGNFGTTTYPDSIVINPSITSFTPTKTGFFVNGVDNENTPRVGNLFFDASSKEITYTTNLFDATLDGLDGVTLTTPNAGDALVFSGTEWINKQNALSNSTDVVITTPANGDILKYNGTNWYNTIETAPSLYITSIPYGQVVFDLVHTTKIYIPKDIKTFSQNITICSWVDFDALAGGTGATTDNYKRILGAQSINGYTHLSVILDSVTRTKLQKIQVSNGPGGESEFAQVFFSSEQPITTKFFVSMTYSQQTPNAATINLYCKYNNQATLLAGSTATIGNHIIGSANYSPLPVYVFGGPIYDFNIAKRALYGTLYDPVVFNRILSPTQINTVAGLTQGSGSITGLEQDIMYRLDQTMCLPYNYIDSKI